MTTDRHSRQSATGAPPAGMLEDRAVIRLAGEDVRGFLNGLVTNDVAGPLPIWAGLLTAQGKALFDFLIWPDGDDLLIDAEAGQADALIRRLSLYRLRRSIAIARDPALAVFWSASRNDAPENAAPDPRTPELGWRWIAAASAEDPPATPAAGTWRTHRLTLGVTEGVAELGSDQTLWLECNADRLNGVSFTKGCYIGQENTARMNWRQKVNRRLAVVPIAEADTVAPDKVRIRYPADAMAVVLVRTDQKDDGAGDNAGNAAANQPA